MILSLILMLMFDVEFEVMLFSTSAILVSFVHKLISYQGYMSNPMTSSIYTQSEDLGEHGLRLPQDKSWTLSARKS